MHLPSILIATVLSFACIACQTTPPANPGPMPAIGEVLAPGDTLKITFSGAPELNQMQKIRPDGKISLPSIGEVEAAGRKPSAIQAELSSRYKKTLQNSEVTLVVESNSFPVMVLGSVNRPGEVNLDRPSIIQAIGRAGGVTRGLGDDTRIRVIREGEDGTKARVINFDAMLKGKSRDVIYLQRGDTIYVPEKWL